MQLKRKRTPNRWIGVVIDGKRTTYEILFFKNSTREQLFIIVFCFSGCPAFYFYFLLQYIRVMY